MVIRVYLLPYDPDWQTAFQQEANLLQSILGANQVAIHHIGSTAIPGIYAKPVIDMLVEVRHLAGVDDSSSAMASVGYEGLGEYGIAGRRYLRKENDRGDRTHHVHIFEAGSPHVERHLAFRDFMIAHPEIAQQYSALKRTLASQLHPQDIEGYMNGKDAFIQQMEQQALIWRRSPSLNPINLSSGS
jgi:GrpB-like predicted nucleotidyltransferase (UPF0157 family)